MDISKEYKLHIPEHLDEKEKILIVDSQQDMRMILVHHLQKLNFSNVVQCRDGMEALAHLRQEHFSVVLCNWELPQMSALELLAEISEDITARRPPFCITVANVSREKLMLAIENGVDEVLIKPFTLADIAPKLRKAFKVFHNPQNPELIYELAKKKLLSEKFDEAEKIYNSLHASSPLSARPLVGLARIAARRKDPVQALAHLAQAEENNSNYVHLYSVRGDVLLEDGNLGAAVHSYKQGIELSPLNPNRYKIAAEILIGMQKFEETIAILKPAIALQVTFTEMNHYLGQAYYHLKDYKNSAKFIRRALEKDPENIVYLNQMALSLKESGDVEEAKKYYNLAIKHDPENQQALFNKAIMLAQSGKKDEAIRILERLIKKFPNFEKAIQKLDELAR